MEQLILHLLGDYATQSDWMAQNKTKAHWPAFVHALVYSLPFLMIGSVSAWVVIFGTHFVIDRWRLARWVVWAKNVVSDPEFWSQHNRHIREVVVPRYNTATGYAAEAPPWLAVWLMIACDNTMHLAINWAALRWL